MLEFSWLSLAGVFCLLLAILILVFAWTVLKGEDDWPTHVSYGLAIAAIIAGGIFLGINHDRLPREVSQFIARFR